MKSWLIPVLGVLMSTNIYATSKITVDVKDKVAASPRLYGIFIEDWSHQVEGGIYGEMLRNRSFDDTKSAKEVDLVGFAMNMPDFEREQVGKNLEIPGWEKTGNLIWSYENARPINARNSRYLRLDVDVPSDDTGIYNLGFCNDIRGVSVIGGDNYDFSGYFRSGKGGGRMKVVLRRPDGTVLCQSSFELSDQWQKISLKLVPEQSFQGALLFLVPEVAGDYYLDMISLFPEKTWKGRKNGLRADIMDFVAQLNPSFVRFPGGCFVEGLGLENAWHWKKTIGPIEEREGHWNVWGWRSSDGMGYMEYLQMCEDLGAEPIHVVNDGISHDRTNPYNGKYEYVPMDSMKLIVQDALDAIEFANGDASTYWGAKRIEYGHPAPFNLKYVEIGNENFGPEYAERYALIYDAIRAKYPDVIIVTDSWGPTNYPQNRPVELLDIHRFTTPYQFALQYDMFDDYDRNGYDVYYGEWCASLDHPHKEGLEVGLYEGAFMTGLEKNSDLVVMQSYAPFMRNAGWRKGKPNMVNFDLYRIYGTPVFWIQKMFADNRVDSLYGFSLDSPACRGLRTGQLSIASKGAQTALKNIRISAENEDLGMTGRSVDWTFNKQEFESAGQTFQTIDPSIRATIKTKKFLPNDFTMKAHLSMDGDGGHVEIGFLVQSATWHIKGNGESEFTGNGIFDSKTKGSFVFDPGRWYEIVLKVKDDQVTGYIDGKPVCEARFKPLKSLYVTVGEDADKAEIVLKVVNISHEAQSTRIEIPGVQLASFAELSVLTHNDANACNSLDNPDNVIPCRRAPIKVSNGFTYCFDPLSVTVMRLRIKE